MDIRKAKKLVLAFLDEQLTPEQREAGFHSYMECWPRRGSLVGIRVAEVGWMASNSGSTWMQSDAPWGLAVCAAVERLLLDYCDEELDEVENYSKPILVQLVKGIG